MSARHYGDYDQNTVIYMAVTTVANGNGVATTIANGNVVVYKDGSNANRVDGVTLNVDWGSTGRQAVTVNTAANTTFYSGGSFFHAAFSNGNCNGSSLAGYGVGSFTLRADSALKPTVANRTLGVDANGFGDANVRLFNCATVNANVTGNITGNVTGSVNSVNQNVTTGTIADNAITSTVIAAGAITATKFAANAIDAAALATSAVTEITDAIFAVVMPECVGDPGATPTFANAVMTPYMAIRNKRDVDKGNSNEHIYNSAGTVIMTACVSDDGNIFIKGKYA